MEIDKQTIKAAFEQHGWGLYLGEEAWPTPDHVTTWNLARRAFDGEGSEKEFHELHEELRRYWQVFRGASSRWSEEKIREMLRAAPLALAAKQLSTLSLSDYTALWSLLKTGGGIKENNDGPSVVAVSKFLHFWNPRLFVIVDHGVVWNQVLLPHWWLWQPFAKVRERTDRYLSENENVDIPAKRSDAACDLPSYFAVLIWASEVIKRNPAVVQCFTEYVKQHAGGVTVPSDLDKYEAAAFEWLLLGLVELKPSGVILDSVQGID